MQYVDPSGAFPKYYGDIQLQHPDWQLGDTLPDGWKEVISVPPRELAEDEAIIGVEAELIDGEYYQKWNIVTMTPEQIAAKKAPETARQKLVDLGFTDAEITALSNGLASI